MSGSSLPREFAEALGLERPAGNGHHPLRDALTDWGNAQRFVRDHGQKVRYCDLWGKWLVYDGKRWVRDDSGEVERLMKETVARIYHDAGDAAADKERKALADHAKRSESKKRITDALYLARSEPGVPIAPDHLDSDPWLFNCENGTIDLRTGELREHRREDLITKGAPVHYDADATAPTFAPFLERILPSEALRRFVRKAIGYAASGENSEEVLIILHGVGANGKSTLVNAVMEALGDYAMQAAPDLLLAKRGSHPTELADLFGARFVASVETDEGRRLAEGLVKQLTGRDPIKARRMREDFWQFDPTHTVFLATNHKPEVRGNDLAIWRRIKLVPFEVTIPEAEQDKRLAAKLRAEMPGVLAWIVRGCLEYQREGLGEPEEVRAATKGYRVEMDVLAAFLSDRCVEHPRASVGATPLYNAYKDWCEQSGEAWLSQRKFGTRLGERGFAKDKSGTITWHGIGLRSDRPNPDGSQRSMDEQSTAIGSNEGTATGDEPTQGPGAGRSSGKGPHGGLTIDKRDAADEYAGTGPSGPKYDINCINLLHEGVMPKKGPEGPEGPQSSYSPQGSAEDRLLGARVRELLEDPPDWLAGQLVRYRRSPERLAEPTCAAVATYLGIPARAAETRPHLEAYLAKQAEETEGVL
jgi:putative DNA primase/helicase